MTFLTNLVLSTSNLKVILINVKREELISQLVEKPDYTAVLKMQAYCTDIELDYYSPLNAAKYLLMKDNETKHLGNIAVEKLAAQSLLQKCTPAKLN